MTLLTRTILIMLVSYLSFFYISIVFFIAIHIAQKHILFRVRLKGFIID